MKRIKLDPLVKPPLIIKRSLDSTTRDLKRQKNTPLPFENQLVWFRIYGG